MIVHVQLLLLMETVTIAATVKEVAILGVSKVMTRALAHHLVMLAVRKTVPFSPKMAMSRALQFLQFMATVAAKMKILTIMSPFHALKSIHDCLSYLQFIEGKGWKRQACPKGTAYNADACLCTFTVAHGDSDDSSSEEDGQSWSYDAFDKGNKIPVGNGDSSSKDDVGSWNAASYSKEAVPCTQKPTNDRSYLQFIEGKGWKRQPCPQGTAYSADDCACSVTVAHEDNDSKNDIHSLSQQSYGNVFSPPSGYGDSSS